MSHSHPSHHPQSHPSQPAYSHPPPHSHSHSPSQPHASPYDGYGREGYAAGYAPPVHGEGYPRHFGRGGRAPHGASGRRYDGPASGDSRDPIPLREPTNTVWVGSLDTAIHTDQALRAGFREFGKVMRIAKHPDRGFCFVHFRTVREAENAVETLSRTGVLGPAVFNYGKMFEYTEEEMNMPYDPKEDEALWSGKRAAPEEGGDGAGRAQDASALAQPPARRPRHERGQSEPTNVLWVGSLPPFVTDDKLREIFEVFGNITTITRMEKGGMAFVHFDTIEHCTMALQTMAGRLIEGGVSLVLNYGHGQKRGNDAVAADGGIPSNETPTNVVYLGQLPANITEADIEALFEPFEGFINSKYVSSTSIGFGHFDSIENARAARLALNHATLKGVPIRVNFGKTNHSFTMADRRRVGETGVGGDVDGAFNLDAMMRPPAELDAASGALVLGGDSAGGALVLPAMGVNSGMGGAATSAGGNLYSKERAAPEMTLDVRLQTVLGTPYNGCGAKDLELSPSQIQAICSMVDACVDSKSEQRLNDTLVLYCPLKAVHVFNILAKRLHTCFDDDPHKKLLVLYAATRVLLGVVTDYILYNAAALNAYLMVLLVASEGQTKSGMDRLSTIVESLIHHGFISKKSNAGPAYEDVFRGQLEEILSRAKAEQDLASLVSTRRRKR
ncbi:unnamed protein product [Phytomonas sp. EM1]|nr:unnamed protein product [Phytomonas sp. EM1]|eukprot:CCW61681.1 unnamed protein product [Phytomonas sp. isolate EM1]